MEKYFDLKNRTALVTGSTRGIGFSIAKGLIELGCQVWIHGRSEEKCKEVAKKLNCQWVAADLSEKNAVKDIFTKFALQNNLLDILVNNAGIEIYNEFEGFDEDIFDKTFEVNIKSAMKLIHAFLPLLKKSSQASVVNITSIHQNVPYPNRSAYSMSKAALAMLTRCLSIELAPHGIRVNNFAPGAVKTEINAKEVREMADYFKHVIPVGRVAETDEMIGSALYLCSKASSYTTGATLYADGGYMQHLVRY